MVSGLVAKPLQGPSLKPGFAGPRTVVNMYSRPGKKVFHLIFHSGVDLASLAKASEGFIRLNVSVLSGTLVADGRGGAHWCVFVETDQPEVGKDELARALKATGRVTDITVLGGDDIIIDEAHFPLKLATGQRAYLLSDEVIRGMLARVREVLGTGGDVVIFEEGEAVGRGDFEALKGMLGADVPARLARLAGMYVSAGIGIPDIVEVDLAARRAVVRVYDNIECVGVRSRVPYSEWVRGHLTGVGSALLGVPMKTEETKCVATGDPYCEFVISDRSRGA